MIFIIVLLLIILWGAPSMAHLAKIEKEKVEKFKAMEAELQEESDSQPMIVGVARPKPKGKHCPLHNYVYNPEGKLFCTWCNKTSSQLLAESSNE